VVNTELANFYDARAALLLGTIKILQRAAMNTYILCSVLVAQKRSTFQGMGFAQLLKIKIRNIGLIKCQKSLFRIRSQFFNFKFTVLVKRTHFYTDK